ncbi:MAG: hypothetical protein NZ518_03830 [Dehalococcoidia bacterium]|nr:hypothetical protein [Dehalococcoidia bacterium]
MIAREPNVDPSPPKPWEPNQRCVYDPELDALISTAVGYTPSPLVRQYLWHVADLIVQFQPSRLIVDVAASVVAPQDVPWVVTDYAPKVTLGRLRWVAIVMPASMSYANLLGAALGPLSRVLPSLRIRAFGTLAEARDWLAAQREP